MLNDSRLSVSYGKTGGGETSPYYIDILAPITVKEVIESQLKDDREWGDFRIITKKTNNIYDNSTVWIEYRHGKLLNEIPEEYANKFVTKMGGSGGWSRSDFTMWIV